jgi:hypothetical protein
MDDYRLILVDANMATSQPRKTDMPYIANMTNANALVAAGELVGNGQCVALAHAAAVIPPTQAWSQGTRVQGNLQLPVGTIIATFDANGHYGNHTSGTSHATIYIGQTAQGIGA